MFQCSMDGCQNLSGLRWLAQQYARHQFPSDVILGPRLFQVGKTAQLAHNIARFTKVNILDRSNSEVSITRPLPAMDETRETLNALGFATAPGSLVPRPSDPN